MKRVTRIPAGSSRVPLWLGGLGGRQRVVGLEIGSSQLSAAVIEPGSVRPRVVAVARVDLDPGIVAEGEVRDAAALRDAVRRFFVTQGLPRRGVRLGIATSRIGVRTIEIAGIDHSARFDNAVRYRAHEVLPLSFDEAVVGHRVLEERTGAAGERVCKVLLVVAPRDQVEPLARACAEAGVRLAGIELEPLALVRLLGDRRAGRRDASVIASIGHDTTSMVVAAGSECVLARVFDRGGSSHRQAVAQELVSSLQYHRAQGGAVEVGEVVITGGAPHLDGLAELLEPTVGVPVHVGDPLARVDVASALEPLVAAAEGSLAVPIALALPAEAAERIDLMPAGLRAPRRRSPRALRVALPLCAAAPVAALGLLFVQARDDVSLARVELAAVENRIDALPAPERPVGNERPADLDRERTRALATVLGGRIPWDKVLGDVARALPANAWLTDLVADGPEPAPAATAVGASAPAVPPPTVVTIQGYTYALDDVALTLARLTAVPRLANVTLATSARESIGEREAVAFTITAEIDPEGGA